MAVASQETRAARFLAQEEAWARRGLTRASLAWWTASLSGKPATTSAWSPPTAPSTATTPARAPYQRLERLVGCDRAGPADAPPPAAGAAGLPVQAGAGRDPRPHSQRRSARSRRRTAPSAPQFDGHRRDRQRARRRAAHGARDAARQGGLGGAQANRPGRGRRSAAPCPPAQRGRAAIGFATTGMPSCCSTSSIPTSSVKILDEVEAATQRAVPGDEGRPRSASERALRRACRAPAAMALRRPVLSGDARGLCAASRPAVRRHATWSSWPPRATASSDFATSTRFWRAATCTRATARISTRTPSTSIAKATCARS